MQVQNLLDFLQNNYDPEDHVISLILDPYHLDMTMSAAKFAKAAAYTERKLDWSGIIDDIRNFIDYVQEEL